MPLTADQKPTLATLLADAKYSGTSDADAETMINARRVKPGVYGSVPMPMVLIWAAYFGVAAKLQSRAADASDALQSNAIAMLAACQGSTPALDLGNQLVMAMLGAFRAAGDVTDAAFAALTGLAPVQTSDAQEAGLPYVGHLDIASARGTSQTIKTPGRQWRMDDGTWVYQLLVDGQWVTQ